MTDAAFAVALLLVHAAATLYMAGLVWFVQRVDDPLLARLPSERFADCAREHQRRTGPVVGPPMLVEAVTALGLLGVSPAVVPRLAAWLGVALLAAVWLSTALLQVPDHRRLAAGLDPATHRRLVATHWIRTVAWSLRGLLALGMLGPLLLQSAALR